MELYLTWKDSLSHGDVIVNHVALIGEVTWMVICMIGACNFYEIYNNQDYVTYLLTLNNVHFLQSGIECNLRLYLFL